MRIGCGTAIAPRKAHIAGCKGTAVCYDTQCLLRHCVSVAEAEREGVGVAQCVPVRLPVGECEAVTERVAQAEGEKLTVPLPLSVPDTLLLPLAL